MSQAQGGSKAGKGNNGLLQKSDRERDVRISNIKAAKGKAILTFSSLRVANHPFLFPSSRS